MPVFRKYWSGNKRIISDFFWVCIINFGMVFLKRFENGNPPLTIMPSEVQSEILAFSEGILDVFFFFFFWSWNHSHIKCRQAKFVIRSLFYLLSLFGIRHLWAGEFFHMDWIKLLFFLSFYGLVTWKYIWLMNGKKGLEERHAI